MIDDYVTIQKLLAAILVGYLLGSIPFALMAARFRGVDPDASGPEDRWSIRGLRPAPPIVGRNPDEKGVCRGAMPLCRVFCDQRGSGWAARRTSSRPIEEQVVQRGCPSEHGSP